MIFMLHIVVVVIFSMATARWKASAPHRRPLQTSGLFFKDYADIPHEVEIGTAEQDSKALFDYMVQALQKVGELADLYKSTRGPGK